MKISKKCQYALKAILELAWRNSDGPVKAHEIAHAQGISARFTEIILNELKHGGFVESRQGKQGGYILLQEPKELTVAEVIEFIEGPISVAPDAGKNVLSFGNNAFCKLWTQVNHAVSLVCENKTFADLLETELAERDKRVQNYII